MNCMIIDADAGSLSVLRDLVGQVAGVSVAAECSTLRDAFYHLQSKSIDLLLTETDLPDMSGVDLVRSLGPGGPLSIFVTGSERHAVEAFSLNAVDYILKPVPAARLLHSIERARERWVLRGVNGRRSKETFLMVHDGHERIRVPLRQIDYVEGTGEYVKVYVENRILAIPVSLSVFESRLPACSFIRIHPSYLAAVDKIERIEDGGVVVNGRWLPVASSYRTGLTRRLNPQDGAAAI